MLLPPDAPNLIVVSRARGAVTSQKGLIMQCGNCEIGEAKKLLLTILTDDNFSAWQPVRALISGAKKIGISREAMKMARRELGILTLTIDGEQHWCHPSRIGR